MYWLVLKKTASTKPFKIIFLVFEITFVGVSRPGGPWADE
jgi:hypothetical protein